MTNSIIEQARGQWPYILNALGIDSSHLKNKHRPCPMCGGENRFRFDDKEGRGTFYCNQCKAGDGIKFLQLYHDWTFQEAISFVERTLNGYPQHIGTILKNNKFISNSTKEHENKRRSLDTIWSGSICAIHGDLVDRYLKARGIKLDSFPSSLRYHPNLPYYDGNTVVGKFPAMVALVENCNNQMVTLHRTYLGDGCKANVSEPKKLMSPIFSGACNGAAIQLYQPINGVLALAEGIETALAFHVAIGIPVWATVSASGMERVILPDHVTEVIIAVDNDASGTGERAAYKLSKRLLSEGRIVKCVMPPDVGSDFADLLAEKNQ